MCKECLEISEVAKFKSDPLKTTVAKNDNKHICLVHVHLGYGGGVYFLTPFLVPKITKFIVR